MFSYRRKWDSLAFQMFKPLFAVQEKWTQGGKERSGKRLCSTATVQ